MDSVFTELVLSVGAPLAREIALEGGTPDVVVRKALPAVSFIVVLPVLVALFFLLRSLYRHTIAKKLRTTVLQDYQKEAEAFERAGEFVSAANVHEMHLNDHPKAAALYEKGGDYPRAASLYNAMGMSDKAKEMYARAGNLEDAAEVALMEGELEEAAALYDKAGRKTDVAKVMKQAGKVMYAVKAFREAGEYRKAAMLLKEEGMLGEAAEMFGFYLHEKEPDNATIKDFYAYALLLEKAGATQKAVQVLGKIYRANPDFEDVKERLISMRPAPEKEEEVPEGKTTLRSFLRGGRMEPVYSLKLWVQILRSLQQGMGKGWQFGLLSPDSVVIDTRNNVSFLKRTQPPAYVSPEIIKGLELDERSDIYAAGVILFEMLTGGLEGLGTDRVSALAEEVPEWLDEIVIKCTRKVREDRYQNLQDIFADLKRLSKNKRD